MGNHMAGAEQRPNFPQPKEATLASIAEQKNRLVGVIRQYSRDQASLWQQVPNLALEADGRSGYNDTYSQAYREKTWPVLQQNGGYGRYEAFVDLNTGEIIDFPHILDPIYMSDGEVDINTEEMRKPAPASDEKILRLAEHLDNLDAQSLVDHLQEAAQTPYFYAYKPQEIEQWRANLREEFGLVLPEPQAK